MDLRLCLLVLCVGSIRAQNSSESLKVLVESLLSDYNKIIPPAMSGTNVSHSLQLLRVVGLEDQVLTLNTWDHMVWTDGRLVWDPASYDGINSIRIPASKLWIPDIVLYNDADDPKAWPDSNAVISSSGEVTYISRVTFRSYCDYKEHFIESNKKISCELKFGSWTYDAGQVDLYNPFGQFSLNDYTIGNSNWKIVRSSAAREENKYSCCPEVYSSLKYKLTLKKQRASGQGRNATTPI